MRRVQLLICGLAVLATHVLTQAVRMSTTPVRAVPIKAWCHDCDTPRAAMMDPDNYADEISSGMKGCASTASYDWASYYMPTTSERLELCSCTELITAVQAPGVVLSTCCVLKGDDNYTVSDVFAYALGLCNRYGGVANPSASSSDTPTTTLIETPTPSPQVIYVDSGTNTNSMTKWGLVGALAVLALVIVVFGIYWFRQRGQRSANKQTSDERDMPAGAFVPTPSTPTTAASTFSRVHGHPLE